jgi:decaprenylphospho-beta-D-ribofuranose 2-oxidase
MEWQEVRSLVGSIHTRSLVARPTTIDQCRETLAFCRQHELTLCPRGAGRSYGDEALNHEHVLLDMGAMNRILEFDEEAAQVTVEAGTRLIDIYQLVHYRLLTLPASPTESHSSVAGAICANVNGKDAWRQGSFADQVVRLNLLTADGETIEIDRSHELFNAVVSGIGLLGIVVEATLQLKPIPSPYVEIDRTPAPDVDALLVTMSEVEKSYDLVVVWVDAYANGSRTGRSVIHAARWIEDDATEPERRQFLEKGYKRLDSHRRLGLALHEAFGPLLSLALYAQRPMLNLFNRLYYAMNRFAARTGRSSNTELFLQFSFEASFTVPPAHLVCGPRGYTVQLTFPREGAREAIVELLGICQSSPCPPVTTILRAHKADDGLLSFSEDGYSLNFEFHPKKRHEAASREAVDRLIEATIKRGGKIHLAKDQVLTPEQFARVYPRYRELLAIKERLDPEGIFTSDLARRVGIGRTPGTQQEEESGVETTPTGSMYPS